MRRIVAIALAAAAMATWANAADITIQTADKSPAQIRAAITDAAHKVCARAYWDNSLSVYKRESCVEDTMAEAMSQVRSTETAMNTQGVAFHATR
jgi:hypothetical protein